jgi:hypothetical protein
MILGTGKRRHEGKRLIIEKTWHLLQRMPRLKFFLRFNKKSPSSQKVNMYTDEIKAQ